MRTQRTSTSPEAHDAKRRLGWARALRENTIDNALDLDVEDVTSVESFRVASRHMDEALEDLRRQDWRYGLSRRV